MFFTVSQMSFMILHELDFMYFVLYLQGKGSFNGKQKYGSSEQLLTTTSSTVTSEGDQLSSVHLQDTSTTPPPLQVITDRSVHLQDTSTSSVHCQDTSTTPPPLQVITDGTTASGGPAGTPRTAGPEDRSAGDTGPREGLPQGVSPLRSSIKLTVHSCSPQTNVNQHGIQKINIVNPHASQHTVATSETSPDSVTITSQTSLLTITPDTSLHSIKSNHSETSIEYIDNESQCQSPESESQPLVSQPPVGSENTLPPEARENQATVNNCLCNSSPLPDDRLASNDINRDKKPGLLRRSFAFISRSNVNNNVFKPTGVKSSCDNTGRERCATKSGHLNVNNVIKPANETGAIRSSGDVGNVVVVSQPTRIYHPVKVNSSCDNGGRERSVTKSADFRVTEGSEFSTLTESQKIQHISAENRKGSPSYTPSLMSTSVPAGITLVDRGTPQYARDGAMYHPVELQVQGLQKKEKEKEDHCSGRRKLWLQGVGLQRPRAASQPCCLPHVTAGTGGRSHRDEALITRQSRSTHPEPSQTVHTTQTQAEPSQTPYTQYVPSTQPSPGYSQTEYLPNTHTSTHHLRQTTSDDIKRAVYSNETNIKPTPNRFTLGKHPEGVQSNQQASFNWPPRTGPNLADTHNNVCESVAKATTGTNLPDVTQSEHSTSSVKRTRNQEKHHGSNISGELPKKSSLQTAPVSTKEEIYRGTYSTSSTEPCQVSSI